MNIDNPPGNLATPARVRAVLAAHVKLVLVTSRFCAQPLTHIEAHINGKRFTWGGPGSGFIRGKAGALFTSIRAARSARRTKAFRTQLALLRLLEGINE